MTVAGMTAWLRQPTTIIGLGTAAATIAHSVSAALAHQMSWPIALGGMAFAVVAMVIPDNTTAQADARKAAVDVATALLSKRLAEMAPVLFADASAVARDVSGAPAAGGAT